MDEDQGGLALMLKKKRAQGSLDMPKKKKKGKKKKQQPPPPEPEPQPELVVSVIEEPPPEENQFFDEACKDADKQLQGDFGKKAKKMNSLMARLHASVQEMKSSYKDLDIEELLSKRVNKDKVAQARAFVHKQGVKKGKFEKKMDIVKTKETKKKNDHEQEQNKAEKEEKEKKIAQMRKQFEEKKKLRQKAIKQSMQKEEQVKKILGKYNGDKPLYVKMEQCQVWKDKKQQRSNQAFLKRRGEQYKPLDYDQIGNHQKIFNQKIKDNALLKQQQQIQKHHELMESNLKLLQNIYRGRSYQMAQQEIEDRRLAKLRRKQQRQKIKQYSSYVRENFKPEQKQDDENDQGIHNKSQGHQQSEEDDEQVDQETRRRKQEDKYPRFIEVKRYKYFQGKSCGQITEKMKAPMSERVQRRVGIGYLEHVKSLPKKRTQSKQEAVEVLTLLKKPQIQMPEIPRPKHYSVRVSETPNRVELSNMLELLKSKDQQRQMKQKYLLRMAGNRDNFQAKTANQIHDDMIHNIERKLSLLHQL